MPPRRQPPVPPVLLVVAAIVSVQIGAAVARSTFDRAGPAAIVLLRLLFGAAALSLFGRARLAGRARREVWLIVGFAVTFACMNLSFYSAIDRLPLGIAVTLEFVGPLAVAVAGSRRPLDVAWVVLAGSGVALLAGGGAGHVRPLGVVLALVAGGFWAIYILLSARVGSAYPGASGLARAMALAALLVAPVGIASGRGALLEPRVLAIGAAIGVLSSAVPWTLELEALRRMPTHVFGVLMSLEPALAALAGLVLLGQHLRLAAVVAIVLVIVASAGASATSRGPAPHEP